MDNVPCTAKLEKTWESVMTDPYVSIEKEGPIATVTFDRHKNLNAFDGQLILELT